MGGLLNLLEVVYVKHALVKFSRVVIVVLVRATAILWIVNVVKVSYHDGVARNIVVVNMLYLLAPSRFVRGIKIAVNNVMIGIVGLMSQSSEQNRSFGDNVIINFILI